MIIHYMLKFIHFCSPQKNKQPRNFLKKLHIFCIPYTGTEGITKDSNERNFPHCKKYINK